MVSGRSLDQLKETAGDIAAAGGRAQVEALDVTDSEAVATCFSKIESDFGPIDILVNNAGIGGPTALARDVTSVEWRETIDVNLSGAFYCAREASAQMIRAGGGCIINIGSVASRIGFARRTPYAASKWGMLGLSHSLAAELGPHGIRVNAILPGAVEGPRLDDVIAQRSQAEGSTPQVTEQAIISQTPLGRLIGEDEVAATAVFLASDAASAITGQALGVCGGLRIQ